MAFFSLSNSKSGFWYKDITDIIYTEIATAMRIPFPAYNQAYYYISFDHREPQMALWKGSTVDVIRWENYAVWLDKNEAKNWLHEHRINEGKL